MNENISRRSRHHMPSAYRANLQKQRSHSASSEMGREPIVSTKEHQSSIAIRRDPRPKSRVAELIERFETSGSSEKSQLVIQRKKSLSQSNGCITEGLTTLSEEKKSNANSSLKIISASNRNLLLTPSTIETSIHNSSDSPSTNENSNTSTIDIKNPSTDLFYSSNINSKPTMTSLMKTTSEVQYQLVQTFIKSQTDHMSDLPDDSFDMSSAELYENQTDLSDRLPTDTDAKKTKLVKCLQEVRATEETYLRKLYVLSFKILDKVKQTCRRDESLFKKFASLYQPLLNAIRCLYYFHNESILPLMEEYTTGHRKGTFWSIFEEHFQKIETLYKQYYVLYDENQNKIQRFAEENELINKAMLKCQVHLDNIYPIAELNCGNQRLLRYILLMQNYMKNLDQESEEYEHTCFVHDELTRIAERCEEHLAISPAQINKLKLRVDNKAEFFDNQQLIWHGSLKKQSPRKNTDITTVYMILFSNCILVYREAGNKLEFKRQLSIKQLTVDVIESERLTLTAFESIDLPQQSRVNYFRFRVNAVEKSYELLVERELQRDKWVNKIRQTAADYRGRSSTIEMRASSIHSQEQQLGTRAPVWVNDIDVTRCQICHNRFGSALIHSRRHHCRSCGRCICSSCSTRKLLLKYCSREGEVRVCDLCFTTFTGINRNSMRISKSIRDPNKTILFGDFRCSSSKSIVWIDLQQDYQLHIYNGKLDQVEDYSINLSELIDISLTEVTQTFVLKSKDRTYRFSIEFNHQITYQKNDDIDKKLKTTVNKLLFYTNLWYDAIKAARIKTTPSWYVRKRDSADSGISNS